MKYHILIWKNTADEAGACVFFKKGCRQLYLEDLEHWDLILSSNRADRKNLKLTLGLCNGHSSKARKLSNVSGCSDLWAGKFSRRAEDPKSLEILAKISVDSKEDAFAEAKSYLLAAEL